MKKLSSLAVSMCMIMSLIVPSFALSSAFNTEVAFLQEYGIPSKLLDSADYDEIHNWYVYAQSGRLYYEGMTTISLYSDEGDSTILGTIPRADMDMTIATLLFLNKNSSIDFVSFVIDYKWADGHPSIRKTDGVTVNWDPSLFYMEPNSFESVDNCYFNGKLFKSFSFEDPTHLDQGGLGYSVKLFDTPGTVFSFEGTAQFNLMPRSDLYVYKDNNKYSTSINIEYAHDKTPYVGSINFSSNSGKGVSMSLPVSADTVAHNKIIDYN